MSWLDDIRAGKPLYGRTGFAVGQYLGGMPTQDAMGNPLDSPESQAARLQQLGFFRYTNPGDESAQSRWMSGNNSWGGQGEFMLNGKPMVQVGANQNRVRDPNAVQWNDEAGWITDPSNYDNADSAVDRFALPAFAGLLAPFLAQGGVFGSTAQNFFGGGEGFTPGPGMHEGYGLGTGLEGAGAGAGTAGAGTSAGAGAGAGTSLESIGSGIVGGSAGLGNAITGAGGGFLSGLLGSALSNPLGLLGAVQIGRGLIGGSRGSTPGPSSSGDKGGNGVPLGKVSRGAFRPNPFTLAALQDYQPVMPRGRY